MNAGPTDTTITKAGTIYHWQKLLIFIGCLTVIHFVSSLLLFAYLFAWGEGSQSLWELNHPPMRIAILQGLFAILQANAWVANMLYRPGIPDWAMLASFGVMSLVESFGIGCMSLMVSKCLNNRRAT